MHYIYVPKTSITFLSSLNLPLLLSSMNKQDGGEDNPFCYFHPKEKLVGICASCLKEKLLYLAAKQGSGTSTRAHSRKSSLSIPKIFALGSLLHRPHQTKSQDFDQDASTTQEGDADSFISIKFEDNGIASWDKGTNSKAPILKPSHTKSKPSNGAVIEHVKPHVSAMWWRKRIGQIFQLVRWKGSSKANVSNKVGGVKVRKSWMRSLKKKKKRTME